MSKVDLRVEKLSYKGSLMTSHASSSNARSESGSVIEFVFHSQLSKENDGQSIGIG